MIIDCISDLHGHIPKLEGGDLLIVAGDLTKNDAEIQNIYALDWLTSQKYEKIVLIAGNHDAFFESAKGIRLVSNYSKKIAYLCDKETEFRGLKIWGSPWIKRFYGMNPQWTEFTLRTEEELKEKWDETPLDTDILVTHSPPYGIFDEVKGYHDIECVGSKSLLEKVLEVRPKLHVFGHIHEGYGKMELELEDQNIAFVNASHVNQYYKPVNKPVRVVL